MKTAIIILLALMLTMASGVYAAGSPVILTTTRWKPNAEGGKIIKYLGGDSTATSLVSSPDYGIVSVMQANNGKFYCSATGGANNFGQIMEFDYLTDSLRTLVSLSDHTGIGVYALVQAADDKLYGAAGLNGPNGTGTIFSYTIGEDSVHVLDTLPTSAYAFGGLMLGSNGNLYGLSYTDGINGGGTIYEFNILTSTFSKKYDLPTGADPGGALLEVGRDTFCGLTSGDGLYGGGTLFRYALNTNSYEVLYNFHGSANGNLTKAYDGKLYGTVIHGPAAGGSHEGNLFSYDLQSHTYTDIHDCIDLNQGGNPSGFLIQASDSMLYGAMMFEGIHGNCGSLYQYNITNSTFTTKVLLDSFNTGFYPWTNMVEYRSWLGTGVAEAKESHAKIYGRNGGVTIERENEDALYVSIWNLLGQLITTNIYYDKTISIPIDEGNALYIVNIRSSGEEMVKKVFVND